jgi:hypothetical protein
MIKTKDRRPHGNNRFLQSCVDELVDGIREEDYHYNGRITDEAYGHYTTLNKVYIDDSPSVRESYVGNWDLNSIDSGWYE